MVLDDLLKKLNLSHDKLTSAEKETYHGWLKQLATAKIETKDVLSYIEALKNNVSLELVKATETSRESVYLKARLENLILLEAFMTSRDRAQEAIERQFKGRVEKVGK